jgi:hypothetical protein
MGFRIVTVCSRFRTSSGSTMEVVCSGGMLMTTYDYIIHGVITRGIIYRRLLEKINEDCLYIDG